jgi:membrane-associated protease RseP (regulator of RpoE activity)
MSVVAVTSFLVAPAWLGVVLLVGGAWSLSQASDADAPATFQPGEISIGEPIALPFSPDAAPAAAAVVTPAPAPSAIAAAQQRGTPGSGWLGLSVAESNVPGRWRIDEVVAGGPAANAGILPGDELRAIEGVPLEAADDVSAVLATIAAGQDVRVAVARADTVGDLVLRAEPRPVPPAQAAQPAVPAWQPVGDSREPQPLPAALPAPLVAQPAPGFPAVPPPALAQSQPAWNAGNEQSGEYRALEGHRALERHRGRTALGVRTVPIDPGLQARFSLSEPAGAYVIGVVHDLPASRAGVPPGSVIVALNDRPVRSPTELTDIVSASPVDRPVAVQFVLPGGESKRADVILQSLSAPLEQALTSAASLPGQPVATAVPTLEPGPVPQRVERANAEAAEAAVRDEIRWLRERLNRLERRLDQPRPTVLR